MLSAPVCSVVLEAYLALIGEQTAVLCMADLQTNKALYKCQILMYHDDLVLWKKP